MGPQALSELPITYIFYIAKVRSESRENYRIKKVVKDMLQLTSWGLFFSTTETQRWGKDEPLTST